MRTFHSPSALNNCDIVSCYPKVHCRHKVKCVCTCLHMHKYHIIFHSHNTIVRSLLNPILYHVFCVVSILQSRPTVTWHSAKQMQAEISPFSLLWLFTAPPTAEQTMMKFLPDSRGYSWEGSEDDKGCCGRSWRHSDSIRSYAEDCVNWLHELARNLL